MVNKNGTNLPRILLPKCNTSLRERGPKQPSLACTECEWNSGVIRACNAI